MTEGLIKKINESRNAIFEELKNPEVSGGFSEEYLKLLHSCLESIFKDIFYVIENDAKPAELNTIKDNVKLLLDIFEKMLALQALSPEIKSFIGLVLECIFNYNKNILESEDINDSVLICQRLLSSIVTMGETINILKSLIKHIEAKELKEKNPLYKGLTSDYIRLLE